MLRQAMRLSVRAFAEKLGVAVRTVSKWEALGGNTQPRPDTQAILDVALSRADATTQARFELLLSDASADLRSGSGTDLSTSEYETWDEDLERVIAFLARQDFTLAEGVLMRWLTSFELDSADLKGMTLYGRSLILLGDMQADQGAMLGNVSAWQTYRQAHQVFTELSGSRRIAQIELRLAVVVEMSGDLHHAAGRYRQLATDSRLSPRDRAHAQLWIGTALSKAGQSSAATPLIIDAIHQFDDLREQEDWSIAHQKLALAYRGSGQLDQASRAIDVASSHRVSNSPLRRVQLGAAQGHVLASDRANLDCGLKILDNAAQLAAKSGLLHQVTSIKNIRYSLAA